MAKRAAQRGTGSGRGDYRYLVQPRGDGTAWYVVTEVPRTLRAVLGKKRLVRSLGTNDVNLARAGRWKALDALKAEITRARTPGGALDDPAMREALVIRESFTRADVLERSDLMHYIEDRAEEIDRAERSNSRSALLDEEVIDVPSQQASNYVRLATGKATPLGTYIERWLTSSGYTDRTKADARTAMAQFQAWCDETGRAGFIESVDDRLASDFRDGAFVDAKAHPKTANKKLSALRQYWNWLDKSLGIRPNPWARKSLPKQKSHRVSPDGPDGPERPFTDDEMLTLLSGAADRDLRDLMWIAALSGMRLEEIGQLRIKDCRDDVFAIHQGKTPAAVRTVPIHSALKKMIRGRISSKRDTAFLFPDLPDTGWDGNRTMAVSKRFNYYRKRLGVDDQRPGARRSKVNFHSFRRWFATKAEEAGQRENVVAAVMGHSKNVGLTFGHYSKATLVELKRQCVEAVRMPKKALLSV